MISTDWSLLLYKSNAHCSETNKSIRVSSKVVGCKSLNLDPNFDL